jgi:glycosyltransferase 2 family protein
LWFVPLTEVVGALARASLPWMLAGVALQFVVRAAATFRMRVVADNQGVALTHLQLYTILLVTQFYAMLLPGLLAGGATWAKYVQRGAGKAAAAAMVLINRAVIVSVVVGVGLCAWVIERPGIQAPTAGVVIAGVLGATVLVVVLPPLPVPEKERAAYGTGLVGRLLNLGKRFLLFLRLSRAGKLTVVASGIIESLLGASVFYCFALAVGVAVDPLAVLWVRAGITVALLLPITVAGLGVREASLVGFGALLGVAPALAVAWSFSILMGTIVVAGVGAVIEANAASGRVTAFLGSRGTGEISGDVRPPDAERNKP